MIVFALMSSLLREASQKKQIDKLALQADAGKRIISTAHTRIMRRICSTLFRKITNKTSQKERLRKAGQSRRCNVS